MENNNQEYLTKAASHYKSLFALPSYSTIIILKFLINIIGSLTAFYLVRQDIITGIIFSFQVLFLPTLTSDFILFSFVFKRNIFFNKKRLAGLSLSISLILIISLNLGAVLQIVQKNKDVFKYAMLFATSFSISIRYLVFSVVAKIKSWQAVLSILLHPLIYFFSLLFFLNMWQPQIFLAIIISSLIFLISSYLFLKLIDMRGKRSIGIGALSLFKGFLANWIAGQTAPLENFFDKLGVKASVFINLLLFRKKEVVEAIMVVPMIHPGPFKNLGSSNLPYSIQNILGKQHNSIVAVPHGTCNHELNLTSQKEGQKIIKKILELTNFSNFNSKATRFVREEHNHVKASCQIFGDIALLTLTGAPANMEDIPKEIGLEIIEKGQKMGVKEAIVIDAHNSLERSNKKNRLSGIDLQNIVYVAEKAIAKALKEERLSLKMGVAKISPKEFGVEQGVGPGGIVILTIIVGEQKIAYITIDGNNMVSGLREEILTSLKNLIDDGEVLTTDTHVVNAVLSTEHGYYSIGEALDKNKLISYIKKGLIQSFDNIGMSDTSYKILNINDVKIFGKEKLYELSVLVDSTYKFVKKIALLIYCPSFILALLNFIIIIL